MVSPSPRCWLPSAALVPRGRCVPGGSLRRAAARQLRRPARRLPKRGGGAGSCRTAADFLPHRPQASDRMGFIQKFRAISAGVLRSAAAVYIDSKHPTFASRRILAVVAARSSRAVLVAVEAPEVVGLGEECAHARTSADISREQASRRRLATPMRRERRSWLRLCS